MTHRSAPRANAVNWRLAAAIGVFALGSIALWRAIPRSPYPAVSDVVRADAAAVEVLDAAEFVTPDGGDADSEIALKITESLRDAIAELPLDEALTGVQSEQLLAGVRERLELYISPDHERYLQSLERLTGRDRDSLAGVQGFLSEEDWASLAERYKNASYAATGVRVQPSVLQG